MAGSAWCKDCETIEAATHFSTGYAGHERGDDVSCEECGCCHCDGCEGDHDCFETDCECVAGSPGHAVAS